MPDLVTPQLALPLIAAAQAQKHLTHNEALATLDALVQLSVLDRRGTAPATPDDGDRHLVEGPASGDWAGQAGRIALFQGGAWRFLEPRQGWIAWVASEAAALVHDGESWGDLKLNSADTFGIGAAADAGNRLAVASPAVLFGHAGTDSRVKVNKATPEDTASLLFQSGYAGRAEMGLAGSDAFKLKVSANGSVWHEAISVGPENGYVGIGTAAPEGPLHILRAAMSPIHDRIDNTPGAPTTMSRKARGTPAAKAPVQENDVVQSFLGSGWDGAAYLGCGNLRWVVDGPVAVGIVPTRIEFLTFTPGVGNTEKLRVTKDGNVGIGTAAPTSRLDVAGPVRVGQYAKAAMPAAAASGAGAIVYVANEAGGPTLAFSDGTIWRRTADGAAVS